MEEDNVQFIDADEYQPTPQGAINYEQVVLQQIKRCVDDGSKEMRGGYFKQKQSSRGTVEVYIEDQRQVYINSVNSLYDLLLPHFDAIMNEVARQFIVALNSIQEETLKFIEAKLNFMIKQEQEQGVTFDNRIKANMQWQIASKIVDSDSYEAVKAYEEKIKAYRSLYQQLIKLYGRQRYLMAQDIDDSRDY